MVGRVKPIVGTEWCQSQYVALAVQGRLRVLMSDGIEMEVGPGGVVVSATVRDLLDGTGLAFDDFGLHELKGLPGQRQLYRLKAAPGSAVSG